MTSLPESPRPRGGSPGSLAPVKRGRGASRVGRSRPGDLRRHARFVVSLPVCLTPVAGLRPRTWRGRTADLGSGGFAVELPTRLPPGTRVAIEVRTGIGPFRLEADVIWTRRPAGAGGIVRHGLCLADRAEVLDLPIGALLGQWLRGAARRESCGPPPPAARRKGARA